MSQKWQVFDAGANPEIDRCRYAVTPDEARGLIVRGEVEPVANKRARRWLRELAPRDHRPDCGPREWWLARPAASLGPMLMKANAGITEGNLPADRHAVLVRTARRKVAAYCPETD